MIRQFLTKHFDSRYYFSITGGGSSANITAKDYDMARTASEKLIRMWMDKTDDKLMVAQIFTTSQIKRISSLTDIVLTTYKPTLNNANEIEWQEESPVKNVGVMVVIAALWRNLRIGIKYQVKGIYSFLATLADIFLRIITVPLYLVMSLLFCFWLIMIKPVELKRLVLEGKAKEFMDSELERAYWHARWISFVLFISLTLIKAMQFIGLS